MEDDWDLQAVVRGCTPTINFSSDYEKTSSSSLNTTLDHGNRLLCFPDSFRTRNAIEESLHELCNPFFNKSQPLGRSIDPFQFEKQQQSKQSVGTTTSNSQSSSRSKRRKNQMKKVCQVPADELCSDTWSWRKYGQKPIKGSPYPRGYYRCSSSKGCLARKQVEKNRSEPTMFIVTYTGEHNHPVPVHRNSLAGTTRYHKPTTPHQNPSSSPNIHPLTQTTSMEDDVLKQGIVEEDGDDGLLDMAVSDDFFEGLDEIVGRVAGDYFSGHLPAKFSLPWMVS